MLNEQYLFQYWQFIERFRGHSRISMGDARAYISARADIAAIESNATDTAGIERAFHETLLRVGNTTPSLSEYASTLTRWRHLDRTSLQEAARRSPARVLLPNQKNADGLRAVSLFTGSYGLDLGFEWAGFRPTVALDNDPASEAIVTANRPRLPFIAEDVAKSSTSDILRAAGVDKGEFDVLLGGPPCQPFSTAGKRRGLMDPRASPLKEFVRIINEAQPKAFVMEEVSGLLNARLRHVPIIERNRELRPEELPGSVWKVVLNELNKTGYQIAWETLNAADYGTPQQRHRVIVMGLRKNTGLRPRMPSPTHTIPRAPTLLNLKPWTCLLDILGGDWAGAFIEMPPKYKKYMKYVPPGGNWRQIPKRLMPQAMNEAATAGGGKMGFYRRLSLFEPSPTLVTTPIMKGSMLIHPLEDRPLSVNEYKVIQGFPLDWETPVPLGTAYRKIGEAVPPPLAYSIASTLKHILTSPGSE